MRRMNLRSVDLNLLVVFDSLMQEGRVSRTADRIGMSQPAVSHALNRLRGHFNDPLFVRTPQGMKPTSLALEIALDVRSALEQIDTVFDRNNDFRPEETQRTFTVGMSDYSGFVLLPSLLRAFQEKSPDSVLLVRGINRNTGPILLDTAEIDIAIGLITPREDRHNACNLFNERWVAICCETNPLASEPLTLESFASASHLNVSTHGEMTHHLDQLLSDHALRRRVVASIPHFLLAPLVIRQSRMIATVASRLAAHQAEAHGLRTKDLPFPEIDFNIAMVWHHQTNKHAAHRWLRSVVLEVASSV